MFKKEPALWLGFIASLILLFVEYQTGTLDLWGVIKAGLPLVTGFFIRGQVFSPVTVKDSIIPTVAREAATNTAKTLDPQTAGPVGQITSGATQVVEGVVGTVTGTVGGLLGTVGGLLK